MIKSVFFSASHRATSLALRKNHMVPPVPQNDSETLKWEGFGGLDRYTQSLSSVRLEV